MTANLFFKKSLASILYYSGLRRKKRGFRILLYHSINKRDTEDRFNLRVSPEDFIKQMEYLYHHKYNVLTLDGLIADIVEKKDFPEKSLAITFDDGYKDLLLNAAPVLNKFNFPFAVFITSDYINKKAKDINIKWGDLEYLSWDDLRELKRKGGTIGSHSASHVRLSDLSAENIEREISRSKEELELKLDTETKLFSYPHGSFSEIVTSILDRKGFKAACSSIIGINGHGSNLFNLARTEIDASDTIHDFEKKLSGCYDWLRYFR